MLDDNAQVGEQRPEFVGEQARVTLEMIEEGLLIGVVVRNCLRPILADNSRQN
jgi:hypothetical protein